MSFLSLIAALLVEHFYPLSSRLNIYHQFTRYANFLERQFNAGQHQHGMVGWLLAVLPTMFVVSAVYFLLLQISPFLAWGWNAIVLYFTMGFKHFSNTNASIADALKKQDIEVARNLLGKWRTGNADALDANEIARLSIEQVFSCSYRQIFGVLVWFVVLSPLGPVGAILYRLASILDQKWGGMGQQEFGDFGKCSAQALEWLDWVPVRLTAVSFAVMGDFEDAVYCWRTQATGWMNRTQGILLSSGAGALGVKLGDPVHRAGEIEFRPELGLGEDADPDYMQSAVSLVWRTLAMWLAVLLLLHLLKWTGV